MEKYTLSLAGSSASLKWKAVRLTWDDFVKRLGTPVITNETVQTMYSPIEAHAIAHGGIFGVARLVYDLPGVQNLVYALIIALGYDSVYVLFAE